MSSVVIMRKAIVLQQPMGYGLKPAPRYFASGKAVFIFRVSHKNPKVHIGLVAHSDTLFRGIRLGEGLFLGEGECTSPVREISLLLETPWSHVYQCVTQNGSVYQVVAIL